MPNYGALRFLNPEAQLSMEAFAGRGRISRLCTAGFGSSHSRRAPALGAGFRIYGLGYGFPYMELHGGL